MKYTETEESKYITTWNQALDYVDTAKIDPLRLVARAIMCKSASHSPIWDARYYRREFSWYPRALNDFRHATIKGENDL